MRLIAKKSWRFYAALIFTLLIATFLILPIGLSVLAGLTKNYFVGVSSGLTTQWVERVWADYQTSIWLSLKIAISCLCITLIIGVPAAYVLAKSRAQIARVIEELLMLPVALPGIATALALIISYGAVGSMRTHWTFVLIGHVLFTLPFMVRSVLAVMQSVDMQTLEESARSLGANFVQRFFGIVLPNVKQGIVAGSLMVFTLSLGEFNISLLLHTPFTQTLPVGLADAYASLRIEIGSAYTVVFFILIVPLLILMQWVSQDKPSKASH